MAKVDLDTLDFGALLVSRVCHDIVNPLGAILNAYEILDDEKSADMNPSVLASIRQTATAMAAKVKYMRIAFGAAGSVGSAVDTGEAETLARDLFVSDRTSLEWSGVRCFMPKNRMKLFMNMILFAAETIPRGGVIVARFSGEGDTLAFEVETRSTLVRVRQDTLPAIEGESATGLIDSHTIQAYFMGALARAVGMPLVVANEGESFSIRARAGG
jgi:histidine phosphotransferase ChpT